MPAIWRKSATVKSTTSRILKNKELDKADADAKAAKAKAEKEAKAAAAKAKKAAAKGKPEGKE
jgi:hypothetical protein